MRHEALPSCQIPHHKPLSQRLHGLLERIRHWAEVSAQRRELRQLDDRALKDMGISRSDAIREADRPFWDESQPDHPHNKLD